MKKNTHPNIPLYGKKRLSCDLNTIFLFYGIAWNRLISSFSIIWNNVQTLQTLTCLVTMNFRSAHGSNQILQTLCSVFADLCSDFADLCSDFADLCSDFADLCSDIADYCSDFADLCSDFADLCSDFADSCSDLSDSCLDFADFDLSGDYEFSGWSTKKDESCT